MTEEDLGNAPLFPSEKDLNERGITFQKVVQNPGDAVYTAYRAIHWVLNPVSLFLFNKCRKEESTSPGIQSGLQTILFLF